MKNKKEKLKLTLVNVRNMKSAEVHFPVITPTRRKRFDSFESQTSDRIIVLGAVSHIREINDMLLRKGKQIDIYALNYWATIYFNECEENARKMFDVLVESKYIPINSAEDMLTILANLDCYYYIENVKNCKEVALFHMKLQCFLGKPIDYKSVPDWCLEEAGKAIDEHEKGIFYKNYYVGLYGKAKAKKENPGIYKVTEGLKPVK